MFANGAVTGAFVQAFGEAARAQQDEGGTFSVEPREAMPGDETSSLSFEFEADHRWQRVSSSMTASGEVVSLDPSRGLRAGQVIGGDRPIYVMNRHQGFQVDPSSVNITTGGRIAPFTRWAGEVRMRFTVTTPTYTATGSSFQRIGDLPHACTVVGLSC